MLPLLPVTAATLLGVATLAGAVPSTEATSPDPQLDLTAATIVVRSTSRPAAEATAAVVLQEEVERRTGLRWSISSSRPTKGPSVILTGPEGDPAWSVDVPRRRQADVPERRPEGYRLVVGEANGSSAVWVVGADPNQPPDAE